MRVGDKEWRSFVAKFIRDTRRIMGRDFAKTVTLPGVREAIANRSGELIKQSTDH